MTNQPTIPMIADSIIWLTSKYNEASMTDGYEYQNVDDKDNLYFESLNKMKELLDVQMHKFVAETLANDSLK